jgi:hypothetical protein
LPRIFHYLFLFFRNIALWLVAFSVLNTSIDFREFIPLSQVSYAHADTDDYYEMESIIELVISTTTDMDNPMPDNTSEDQQSTLKKAIVFDFSFNVKKEKNNSTTELATAKKYSVTPENALLPQGYVLTLIQPPDIA